jgi:hypothetical protein
MIPIVIIYSQGHHGLAYVPFHQIPDVFQTEIDDVAELVIEGSEHPELHQWATAIFETYWGELPDEPMTVLSEIWI